MAADIRLPKALLRSLLGVSGFDEQKFLEVHESGEQVVSVRFHPLKMFREPHEIFPGAVRVPWSRDGYYLPARPSFTLDPLLHAGAYYVQEASGMFLEQCLLRNTLPGQPLRVLDLCAAPGGKSTLLQSLLPEGSLLVSNEVIKSRVGVLEENMTKWGAANTIVTNNDPSHFARLNHFFDVMVVDAPCSGSGLFRKDPLAIQEWSEALVNTCSLRQQRILSDVLPSLKPGGLLIYSTCSYSVEENEDICDWLITNHSLQPLPVAKDASWNITLTDSRRHHSSGYRFFPDKLKGEGFFTACFRKGDEEEVSKPGPVRHKLIRVPAKDAPIIHPFINDPAGFLFYSLERGVFAFPRTLEQDLQQISASLYIKKAGVHCGKLMQQTLVPDHELALSSILNDKIPRLSLKKEQALQYLRKEAVTIPTEQRGWAVVQFDKWNLGWVKILNNRINNYYPKEWRILKSGNS